MSSPAKWVEIARLAQPAAGANGTRRIPGETYERLDAVRFLLTASAVAGNRFVSVDYLDGDSTVIARVQSTTAVTAGTAVAFTFGVGLTLATSGGTGEQLLPLLDIVLPPGCRFRVTIGNIDVGDQITNILLTLTRIPSQLWAPSRGSTPDLP